MRQGRADKQLSDDFVTFIDFCSMTLTVASVMAGNGTAQNR
jgi:hypothetical protein